MNPYNIPDEYPNNIPNITPIIIANRMLWVKPLCFIPKLRSYCFVYDPVQVNDCKVKEISYS